MAATARRRARGATLACVAAAALFVAIFGAAPRAFLQPPQVGRGPSGETFARRRLLASAGALLAAGAESARATPYYTPPKQQTGVQNNPTQPLPPVDFKKLKKQRMGNKMDRLPELAGTCWEADADQEGLYTTIGTSNVFVYDSDSDCKDGSVLITAVGLGKTPLMNAKTGPVKHKFVAAGYESFAYVSSFADKIGQCVDKPQAPENSISFYIANTERGGKCL